MSKTAYEVVNMEGKSVGTMDILDSVFSVTVKKDLIHQVVRWQRAKKRSGTHSVLNRAAKTGGGKKPWKQKGTGNARAGSRNSPVWVGGAVAHGPQPRSYDFDIPKRVRAQALCGALSAKRANKKLLIVDELTSEGKTKQMAQTLHAVGAGSKGVVLLVPDLDGDANKMLLRASKNLPKVKTVPVAGLNVYDLVNAEVLVCSKAGVEALEKRFSKNEEK